MIESANESQKLEKSWSGWNPYLLQIHVLIDNHKTKHENLSHHDISVGDLLL